MIVRRLQAGRNADGAIYVGGQTARAAYDVMVVVSDTHFVASRMTGRLDASNKAGSLQGAQIVVHCLG